MISKEFEERQNWSWSCQAIGKLIGLQGSSYNQQVLHCSYCGIGMSLDDIGMDPFESPLLLPAYRSHIAYAILRIASAIDCCNPLYLLCEAGKLQSENCAIYVISYPFICINQ